MLAQSATLPGPARGCVDLCTCRLIVQRQNQKMHESEANLQCHVGHFDWGYFLPLPNLRDSCGNHGEFFFLYL